MSNMEFNNIQNELRSIIQNTTIENSVKVTKLESLAKKAKNTLGSNTPTYYDVVSTLHEAMGDCYMRDHKIIEAEKAYRSMLAYSKLLYELDKKTLDYRFGFSCYKLASYYLTMMGCHKLEEKPKTFNEMQNKVVETCDSLYKTAISSTMSNARKGLVNYAQLQAMAMSEMALLYASKGDYKLASGFGVDGVNVSKSVYKVVNTKEYMYLLINRINHLATIYKLLKKSDKTIECLKESIDLAKERIHEEPVVLGIMIGKCYMNIGACYDEMKEVLKADDAFEKGLEYIAQGNKSANYTMMDEVIKGYMKVGDHYKMSGREAISRSYLSIAYEKANAAYEEKESQTLKNLIDTLSKELKMN